MKTELIGSYFLLISFSIVAVQVQEVPEGNVEQKIKNQQAKSVKALPATNASTTKSPVLTEDLPPEKTVKNKQEQTADFIPSEEISEDLVVSFPVDI